LDEDIGSSESSCDLPKPSIFGPGNELPEAGQMPSKLDEKEALHLPAGTREEITTGSTLAS
jgi:hypothetical protein